jgi:hypothetical protein
MVLNYPKTETAPFKVKQLFLFQLGFSKQQVDRNQSAYI